MCGSRCRAVALGTLVILVLSVCAEVSQNPKTTIGALGGAAVGALIAGAAGGSGAGIAAGVIGGWLLGGLVGNVLDERDRRLAVRAGMPAAGQQLADCSMSTAFATAATGGKAAWTRVGARD